MFLIFAYFAQKHLRDNNLKNMVANTKDIYKGKAYMGVQSALKKQLSDKRSTI